MKLYRIIICFLYCFIMQTQTAKSQITDEASFNQIFSIIYSHNFENDTEGAYKETEWKRDWNNPTWANHALGYGKILNENSSKNLQIKFPKGEMGMDSSGVQWHGKFSQGYDELYLTYKIKFSSGFSNKDLQGKLPGFSGAASNTGGNLPTGTDGWSTRYMFHGTQILFYLYYPEMYKDFGDASPVAGKTYYGSAVYFEPGFTLQPNVWYTVTQRVVMNTIGKADGLVEGYLNGKLCALKTGMRFRDISSIQIDRINFGNFLGGSGKPPVNDEFIHYDDFCVFAYKPWVNVPRGNTKSPSGRTLFMPDLNQISAWGTNVNALNVTSSSADVQWSNYPLGITGYVVERKADNETAFKGVASLAYGQNSYKDLNLTSGRTYTYRIKAYNNTDFTDYSKEFSITTTALSNNSPVIKDQQFSVQQNTFINNYIGKIAATDPDAGQSLKYEILSGNSSGIFTINTATGELKTLSSLVFKVSDTLTYVLTVKVSDNAPTPKSSLATITVKFIGNTPVNSAPTIQNQLFSVKQELFTSTLVGKIVASDVDADQKLTYTITSGNNSGIFSLNSSTGELTTFSINVFKAGDTITHSLNITVSDNAANSKSSSAAITVKFIGSFSVATVNNSPSISNQTFSLHQNNFNANYVGKIIASDPDAGQTLTFKIEGGNEAGIFAINSSNGDLTTTTSDVFKSNETLLYTLNVKVTDTGTTPKSASAAVLVKFTGNTIAVNTAPVINNQAFIVKEQEFADNYIGNVIATDEASQKLAYSISSGNISGLFQINQETGALTTTTEKIFDSETRDYNLTVAVSDGSKSSSATVTVTLEGKSKKQIQTVNMKVYPNPSKGNINVEIEVPEEPLISGITENTVNIQILDLAGNSMVTKNSESNNSIENFDLSEFKNGTYIVSVKKSNLTISRRLIINK